MLFVSNSMIKVDRVTVENVHVWQTKTFILVWYGCMDHQGGLVTLLKKINGWICCWGVEWNVV